MSIIDRILAAFRRITTASPERLVRYKEQKIYTMVNTLTLSTEMDTLYLIDNGRAIAFPLNSKGVLIGTLKGQITVATAIDGGGMTEKEAESDAPDTAGSATRVVGGQSIKLPITENVQWTFLFNKRSRKLFAIGATDIDINLLASGTSTAASGAASANCVLTEFSLDSFVILLRRVKNALVIEELAKNEA